MKLIITRHGSSWGGPVGSAVIDLDKETICYFEEKIKTTGDITEVLIKYEEIKGDSKSIYDEIENTEVDLDFLIKELSGNLYKDVDVRACCDAQEDYVILDNEEKVELIFRDDNEAFICLTNREVNGMLRTLIKLVR